MSILKELKIPHMGSVENAKLLSWVVREGETYADGDILYEVETDKTATEIEADGPGILVRQLAEPDAPMKVGDLVGLWAAAGTSQGDIAAALAARDSAAPAEAGAPAAVAADAPVAPAAAAAAPTEEGQRLSPLVRRLAAEHGVDLTTLAGTGPGGRITGDDVLAAAGKSDGGAGAPGDCETIAHSLRRQTIARRMTEAAAIPTLTADMEIDLGGLFARRAADKAAGRSISVLGQIAHTAVEILVEQGLLNAHWTDSALLRFKSVHLGVAVETDDGLVVPVIRDAQSLDAEGLTAAIAELAEKARSGALKPADLEGGTFTISNPGSLGPTIRAEALLNPPQIALLGLPGIVRAPRAVERDGAWAVEVRQVVRPSLSFDHRAVDGGPVIAFLNLLKERLEQL
ncbi:dihydrolipoamide acetyltransferase family protein [Sphingopyxis sp. OPL5]|uniref:dihydrolipoamide acetyltransferase family protein n=1 Tax=Sphingopyxis sp. OPL5 TaxID=2486273 RepID=UPI00223BC596|nr:dihydrolipoamide acetyltransferase family protein [Sphingopyxis sp. OPL5]